MNGWRNNCWHSKMMSDRRRLNLSFSMTSPLQREAWDILSAVPVGQRIDALCLAVCREHDRDSLLDAVRTAIREELGGAGFVKEESEQPQGAGDVGDDVLGFLLALQNDGGEEKPVPLL